MGDSARDDIWKTKAPAHSRSFFDASSSSFTPSPCSRIRRAVPEIAVSPDAPSDAITFSCSCFVRFWLSLNFASIFVTAISNPTMWPSIRSRYAGQWAELSEAYRQRMLSHIVGFEIAVTKIEAKFKLSQNRTKQEQENVIASLRASPDTTISGTAELMREQGLGAKKDGE